MARCSRCKTDGHPTRGCKVPWKEWSEQECDRCGKDTHETGSNKCSYGDHPTWNCSHCGHQGDHKTADCLIQELTPENILQYTKTKCKEAETALEELKKAAGSRDIVPGITREEMEARMKNAKIVRLDSEEWSSITNHVPNDSQVAELEANLELAPRPTDPIPQSPTPSGFTIAKSSSSKKPNASSRSVSIRSSSKLGDDPAGAESESILANSVEIELLWGQPPVRKYRIVLGTLWNETDDVKPTDNKKPRLPKKETARAVLEDLFLKHYPISGIWASDFVSHIVCVGKLYSEVSAKPVIGETYQFDHYRPGPGDSGWHLVRTRIVYEGCSNWDSLKNYTSLDGSRPLGYLPDEDLRILNLITWKDINSPGFRGARFGKKFFPTKQHPKDEGVLTPSKKNPNVVYELKTGFFSSARPAHGKLLLTINTAMSAFYPAMNLQEWINMRWNDFPNQIHRPDSEQAKELKGVRVTFEGDDLLDNGNKKMRVIWGFSDKTLAATKFSKLNDADTKKEEINVLAHMRKGKSYSRKREIVKN